MVIPLNKKCRVILVWFWRGILFSAFLFLSFPLFFAFMFLCSFLFLIKITLGNSNIITKSSLTPLNHPVSSVAQKLLEKTKTFFGLMLKYLIVYRVFLIVYRGTCLTCVSWIAWLSWPTSDTWYAWGLANLCVYWYSPWDWTTWPPALQSRALPTKLVLPP